MAKTRYNIIFYVFEVVAIFAQYLAKTRYNIILYVFKVVVVFIKSMAKIRYNIFILYVQNSGYFDKIYGKN